MRRLILLLALALASCGGGAPDGYRFEKKEFTRARPNITFVVHPSIGDLRKAGPKLEDGRELMAWGEILPNECRVHIVDPAVSYQPQWIGHEVTHCVYGRWHG
ncbi:hypothetical protein KNJ79_05445 [Sphingopyxis indica]|uniref:hypothetical protein n=1 Tax=Sphingopyxis indica TaxID=436663 RepID=UPI002938D604|nr:hypothetical protein [Sphingopyxis indica]WOF44378.1 hypothetical protein KNJ79_05445 [Sphingopyxis indica]